MVLAFLRAASDRTGAATASGRAPGRRDVPAREPRTRARGLRLAEATTQNTQHTHTHTMSPAAAAAAAEQALSTLWRNQLRMQRQAQEHLPAPVEDHGGGLSALELLGPGAVSEPDQPEVRPETAPSGRGRGRGKAKAAAPPAAAPAAARQPKKPRGRPAAAAAAAPLQ
ncbi:MAG: hypothetical protein CMJ19_16135, partial [Phycisphaeraceae bacterium]|nr:hypothetical protein [Phycisphaeraceae bacterium]